MSPPASPRSRATSIGAAAFLLLALPFLVLGLYFLDVKARVELRCAPAGPCVLSHEGWLSRVEVGRFSREEVTGVKLERTRSARRSAVPIFRPVLETTRGPQPLAYQWMEDEAEATAFVDQVQRFLAAPGAEELVVARDDRRASLRVGGAFTVVGVMLLGVCLWLGARTWVHRRAERATAVP